MTLEPPIAQQDVERKQLFRTRGGGTARVVACRPNSFTNEVRWAVDWIETPLNPWDTVTSNGSNAQPGWHSFFDLVSRISPEPAMESQVVVEDRRPLPSLSAAEIGDLDLGELFQDGGQIYRNLSGRVQEKISGDCAPTFVAFETNRKVARVPHLRLRLVLEQRT